MLTDQDRTWLRQKYPDLTVGPGLVSGILKFTAAYNEKSRKFYLLENGDLDEVEGIRLSGQFEVSIRDRQDKSVFRLPALHVEKIDHTEERHFNPNDNSACYCNPLEEYEFLTPQFDFKRVIEELIIPFLYGQLFFTAESRWPWPEYAHGVTGLLEAYFKNKDSSKALDCIERLCKDWSAWPRIKSLLTQKTEIKGHIPCFCPRKDHIRRCHPSAWQGVRQLRLDVKSGRISLP